MNKTIDAERVIAELRAMYGQQALDLAVARSLIPLDEPEPEEPVLPDDTPRR